jgi:hypothetical protein
LHRRLPGPSPPRQLMSVVDWAITKPMAYGVDQF